MGELGLWALMPQNSHTAKKKRDEINFPLDAAGEAYIDFAVQDDLGSRHAGGGCR